MIQKILRSVKFVSVRYGGGIGGFCKGSLEAISVFCTSGPRQFYAQVRQNVRSSDETIPWVPVGVSSQRLLPTSFPCQATKHTKTVAVVICVHNALDDVRRCLASVVQHSTRPYTLVLVDDGSDPPTRDFLAEFAQENNAVLIRNELARGYTLAANQGLKTSVREEYVLLLNSDTIVSAEWLDRMMQCAESSEKIGVVGPLSNTASWQSVPAIEENGDWATNPLPPGTSVDGMAHLIAAHSPCLYPRLSFVNGFCLLTKQSLLNDIGYFDEETFGRGFCEENDFCMRARLRGWELAVADDVYIFHAQSKSYSSERRKKIAEESQQAFVEKYNQRLIEEGVRQCRQDRSMQGIRARAAHLVEFEGLKQQGMRCWQGKKIAIVLPAKIPGGGSNVVVAEATAMMNMGVEVKIINLVLNRSSFYEGYPKLEVPVLWADNGQQVPDLCSGVDAVIATACQSVPWLLPLSKRLAPPKIGYYIQDYEPNFYQTGSIKYEEAEKSYNLIPNVVRFTKTRWNRDELYAKLGLDSKIIGVSLDNALFRPYPRREISWPNRPLRIMAMIRPSSPWRGAELTMRIFARLSKVYPGEIEFIIFGAESDDPSLKSLTSHIPHRNLGIISAETLVSVLTESDIFVDFSQYQAMGLTAMEAMACGLAVVVTNNGGAHDFAIDNSNCLLVDTSSEESCFRAVKILIENHRLRNTLQAQAICDMAQHSPVKCAYNILNLLLNEP